MMHVQYRAIQIKLYTNYYCGDNLTQEEALPEVVSWSHVVVWILVVKSSKGVAWDAPALGHVQVAGPADLNAHHSSLLTHT